MKYYSELTKKVYDSPEDVEKAEVVLKEEQEKAKKVAEEAKAKKEALIAEKQTRAKEVEDAYKEIIKANKKYEELKNKFIRDYGHFWMNYKDGDSEVSIFEVFNDFFNGMFR